MVVPMLRPDVFGALASHAGDALFEACYLPEFPKTARLLRDEFEGSWDAFFEAVGTAEPKWDWIHLIETYGYAAAYSPDPTQPGRALIPFDVNGRLDEAVWAQWLDLDPVRMAPRHADELRSLKRIYLDAGNRDEYFLDLGARAFAAELHKLGVEHTVTVFDGTHARLTYRYPGAIRELILALAPAA